jgi:phosphoglucosamine mutase
MRSGRGNLFGTDGARGIANADLTPELALAIGRAFGSWLLSHTKSAARPVTLLGRDTRVSGSMLGAAVAAGLCSAGVDVRDCGILTTPGVHLLAREEQRAGGVVISASHNPPDFNGIKLVAGSGRKLTSREERRLENLVFAEEDLASRPTGAAVGEVSPQAGAGEAYLALLFRELPALDLRGLKVVLDCSYGAAYELAPEAFRRAGAEVVALHAEPEGLRINVEAGALNPAALAEAVPAQGADLGLAFDGDADRAIVVDGAGQVWNGDGIKYLLAADLQARGRLASPLVVGTVMSTLGLELALAKLGIQLHRTGVGDRPVADEMERIGAGLGGEQSGHIIFAELGVGDGLYTGLRVCEVVARTGQGVAELCAPMRTVPQILLNVPVRDKHSWETSEALGKCVREWEARLDGNGRILIRPSGTEALVRVMVEAVEEGLAYSAAEALADLLAHEFGYGELLSEE